VVEISAAPVKYSAPALASAIRASPRGRLCPLALRLLHATETMLRQYAGGHRSTPVFMRDSSPTPLAGRTAIITGAGSGIGRSLAQRLSAHGCPVAIADANGETLRQTADALAGPALARTLDVRDRQGQVAFAAQVREWSPAPIGAVFNNAGVAMGAPVAGGAPEDHDWVMAINFEGVVNGVRAFLPILLEQRDGAIVNTSSIFGFVGVKEQSAYCASKFAVRGFTDSLRQELRGTGVRAIVVHPGGIKTNIVRDARVHPGLRDERTREREAAEFEARARTTPEQAAEIIHRGVDAGKTRILVGRDAQFVELLARLTPTHAVAVLEGLERLAARRASRATA
jgi:NAD(P)-dependent dehydrogenase (short-subunit alcohol dehydrogenase family)